MVSLPIARFVDDGLAVGNRPSDPWRLWVHRSGELFGLIRRAVVVLAADNALRVDGELNKLRRRLLVAMHHAKDAERLQIPVFSGGVKSGEVRFQKVIGDRCWLGRL